MKNISSYTQHIKESSPDFDGEGWAVYDRDGEPVVYSKGNSLAVEFENQDISNIDVSMVEYFEFSAFECEVKNSNFRGSLGEIYGHDCDFSESDMSVANLKGSLFDNCKMINVDFSRSNLAMSKFKNCLMIGAKGLHTCSGINTINFVGVDFTGVDTEFFERVLRESDNLIRIDNYSKETGYKISIAEYFKNCKGLPEKIARRLRKVELAGEIAG